MGSSKINQLLTVYSIKTIIMTQKSSNIQLRSFYYIKSLFHNYVYKSALYYLGDSV